MLGPPSFSHPPQTQSRIFPLRALAWQPLIALWERARGAWGSTPVRVGFLAVLLALSPGSVEALEPPGSDLPRRVPTAVLVGVEPAATIPLEAPIALRGVARLEDWTASLPPGLGLVLDASEPLAHVVRIHYPEGRDLAAEAAYWRAQPGVIWAAPERSYRITESLSEDPPTGPWAPNDPLFVDGSQWGLLNRGPDGPFGGVPGEDVRAREGWAVTTGSTAVRLGIVDTGTDLGQPELAGDVAFETPRIVAAFNSSDEGPMGSPWDSVGHGTMVAGVAAARSNNGPLLDGRGVAGMCGGAGGDSAGCRLVLVKATPRALLDALSSERALGILYAVDRGARAINLSFASDDEDPLVLAAMSFAARRGAVVICGAGNGQDARLQYPGAYARYGVGVSVAATRSNGQLARFSTRGSQIDVAAPGEDIWSTYLTYPNAFGATARNYQFTSGTSFSAPLVTGLAGLALALQPSLTDNEFQAVLRATARDVGAPGRDDTFGWGVPDAGALLRTLVSPAGLERGTVPALHWAPVGSDSITLSHTRVRFDGCRTDGRYLATRYEVLADVTLPPGRFLAPPMVVVRTHGTRGWGPGTLFEYDFGWGEAVPGSVTSEGFTLRTYVYDIPAVPPDCPSIEPTGFMPVAPAAATFAWSAIGVLDQPPVAQILSPAEGAAWSVDSADTVRWQASDNDSITAFELAWSSDGGTTWRTVATLPGTARSAVLAAPCEGGQGAMLRLRAIDGHLWPDETSVTRTFLPERACLPGENPSDATEFALLPVAPSPAVGDVTLRFQLPAPAGPSPIEGTPAPILAIHDVRGRVLRRWMLTSEASEPQLVVWDGRDSYGRAVAAGMYFARLTRASLVSTQRLVYLGSGGAP